MGFVYAVVVLLLVLCGAAVYALLPGKSTPAQRAPFTGVNYAHRGLHSKDKTVPENSLAAFRAAVEAGYGMELDIALSKDGEVMVFHDDDLPRVCGVEGRLDGRTLAELRQLRLEGSEEGIPLFTQMLEEVAGRQPLIVELKTHPTRNEELCQKAWAILQSYNGPYCIESFDPRIVGWFYKNAPQVLRGQLASRPKSLGMGLQGFLIGTLLCNFMGRPHFIAYDTGYKPLSVRFAEVFAMKVAWTVRPENDVAFFEKHSDGVIFEYYLPAPRYTR